MDHVVALARGGSDDVSNLRPAHGAKPCETCGGQCNRSKGAKTYAPIIRHSASLQRPGGRGPGGASKDTAGVSADLSLTFFYSAVS